MHTYKLTISYDGTGYCGWQKQPNGISIQELIEKALSTILQTEIIITGAGRTDAGVHALHQVAHFHSKNLLDLAKLQKSLNGILPRDIRILNCEKMSDDFHARYSAKCKTYCYHLHLHPIQSPFSRLYTHHIPYSIDLNALAKAKKHLIGTHNFAAFANEANAGSAAKNPIRTIYSIELEKKLDGIVLEFKGDGFLYKMVRNIVGTLLEVAEGKISEEKIPTLLAKGDRRLVPKAAPSKGLILTNIEYSL